jgi:chromate transporter
MTLRALVLYFLRLGALGFGGPVALANAMRRDLVDARGWISAEEYDDGLALAAACPGPLAYQLAVYCGFVRFGFAGAIAVAVAFALPPFIIVVTAAALYRYLETSWQLRALFYGIAPAIVAIIAKSCWNLGRKTLRTDVRAWTFAVIACAIVIALERELVWLFIGAGVLGIFVFSWRKRTTPLLSISPQLFLFFFKTGMLVFGSGLVIVPFLKAQVVDQYHWLTNRQFLDSVAIGMISPGPVVITATFVGFLLAGFTGSVAATTGIFMPPVLFVLLATPLLRRYRDSRFVRGFIRGVSSAVVGVLVATTWLIARSAIVDPLTIAIAAAALAVIVFTKTPEPAVIATAGIIGILVSA